ADDLLYVLRRLLALDLGDHRDARAELFQARRDGLQVGGSGDEGDGEQVDAVLDRELDPAEVDAGGRRQVGAAGDVHSLVRGEGAADLDVGANARGRRSAADPEADRAVGEV